MENRQPLIDGRRKVTWGFGGFPGPPAFSPRSARRHTRLKTVFASCVVVVLVLLFYHYPYLIRTDETVHDRERNLWAKRLVPRQFCASNSSRRMSLVDEDDDADASAFKTRSPLKVLLIPRTSFSLAFQTVTEILVANRIGFKSSVAGKNLPDLIKLTKGVGKYGAIFFEDYRSYLGMDKWNRELLDKYCRSFNVGIVAFVLPPANVNTRSFQLVDGHASNRTRRLPFVVNVRQNISDLHVNASSSMLRIVKGGQTSLENLPVGSWVTFRSLDHHSHSGVLWASSSSIVTVLQAFGRSDGIRKVLFGIGRSTTTDGRGAKLFVHWLQKLLLLDAVSWVSGRMMKGSLTRYLMVDVDDVFVGRNNALTVSDINAMLDSQRRISALVPGFRFNLGFSGGTFAAAAAAAATEANEFLVRNADRFWWFPHEWQHLQPHKLDNASVLVDRMLLNRHFAVSKGLPVNNGYAVSPHHSGVYPIHEQLYEAWKRVWGIGVTSTEEYPHLHPSRLRRGFVHRGIRVLPRQTCGLYTKNLFYDDYPGGPEVLEASVRGGQLMQTLVFNSVSVFMTHVPNYAGDRLAPYVFESVLSMATCWTNLEFRTAKPQRLADIYFDQLHPDEKVAVWGDPCDDDKHLQIWSDAKSCSRLPHFLIIGPQKTGTTALHNFLNIHPRVESNFRSSVTFEEVQFFSNNKNYQKGIDWYMDRFPNRNDSSATFLFEKSATYFDKDVVPLRAHRLLSDAKLIAIVISPAARAYSWYQHAIAHGDLAASTHSFHQVIAATANASKPLRSLQSRCLEPGKYASHLERWLAFYPSRQLRIVDGEELKLHPASVMDRLQQFLSIDPILDYSKLIQYDKKKGFYCQVVVDDDDGTGTGAGGGRKRNKCLGKGKGRTYPPMTLESQKFLREYYRLHNEALLKLLKRLGYNVPDWLQVELSDFQQQDYDLAPPK